MVLFLVLSISVRESLFNRNFEPSDLMILSLFMTVTHELLIVFFRISKSDRSVRSDRNEMLFLRMITT